ncbi:hypothetical protein [Streptomyces sp. ME18-1-4]|uniref:hypothetical protein n=1 Tax=Streptomyces sp. ME18-1-4 TaxID=3028685 RepID=UPI0029A7DCDB|nr:hypothetical protein [Streptomyces sp. ME18-1-4]MDX3247676.1 hypothetical protein [Streptomyces sp. ME18-1-4]
MDEAPPMDASPPAGESAPADEPPCGEPGSGTPAVKGAFALAPAVSCTAAPGSGFAVGELLSPSSGTSRTPPVGSADPPAPVPGGVGPPAAPIAT